MTAGRRLLLALAGTAYWVHAAACEPRVEEQPGAAMANLRAHTDAYTRCVIDEPTYRELIAGWLRQRRADAPVMLSLGLGRAVYLPWISQYLADGAAASPEWRRIERGRSREHALFAKRLLNDDGFLQRVGQPFGESPYRVVGVSFEKLLLGPAREHSTLSQAPAIRVPYDAQLWLRLQLR